MQATDHHSFGIGEKGKEPQKTKKIRLSQTGDAAKKGKHSTPEGVTIRKDSGKGGAEDSLGKHRGQTN